jgi:2-hydroxycyclohexanecarboxyl-CoA dehydrogenase
VPTDLNKGDLTGMGAVVTGGAGEIGAAIVEALAERGARLVFGDIDADRGEMTVDRLTGRGLKASFIRGDMTSFATVTAFVEEATSRLGTVDIAVGGIGWTSSTNFVDETEDYWRRIVDLNLMSSVYLTHAVLPRMIERKFGRVVLVSSLAGRLGRRQKALYSAAKAGIIGFARAVALEVATKGVTVNCIAPGATDTKQMRDQGAENTAFALATIPRSEFAEPRDQAHAVAFLAMRESAHITGQVIAVDGGATMV